MTQQATILICDDDDDDRFLASEAFREAGVDAKLEFLDNGEELVTRLKADAVRPALVLLDLNMPRVDGREALARIRKDPDLRRVPVVVVTTSGAPEDVDLCYELGARSFVRKPRRFQEYVDAAHLLGKYWLGLVERPTA